MTVARLASVTPAPPGGTVAAVACSAGPVLSKPRQLTLGSVVEVAETIKTLLLMAGL